MFFHNVNNIWLFYIIVFGSLLAWLKPLTMGHSIFFLFTFLCLQTVLCFPLVVKEWHGRSDPSQTDWFAPPETEMSGFVVIQSYVLWFDMFHTQVNLYSLLTAVNINKQNIEELEILTEACQSNVKQM